MPVLRELAPAAFGVAIAGAVTYLLLARERPLGAWLLAVVLLAHGWVHVLFVLATPDPPERAPDRPAYPFVLDSWLLRRLGAPDAVIRAVGGVLVLVTVLAFVAAATATLGWLLPGGWWAMLAVTAAVASTVTLGVFYSPLLSLGFIINAALVWLALGAGWTPEGGLPS